MGILEEGPLTKCPYCPRRFKGIFAIKGHLISNKACKEAKRVAWEAECKRREDAAQPNSPG